MKVDIKIEPICSKCGHTMMFEVENKAYFCVLSTCESYGVRYKAPSIDLKLVEDKPLLKMKMLKCQRDHLKMIIKYLKKVTTIK